MDGEAGPVLNLEQDRTFCAIRVLRFDGQSFVENPVIKPDKLKIGNIFFEIIYDGLYHFGFCLGFHSLTPFFLDFFYYL